MSEKAEITFMQTRLIRLASEEWHFQLKRLLSYSKEWMSLGI